MNDNAAQATEYPYEDEYSYPPSEQAAEDEYSYREACQVIARPAKPVTTAQLRALGVQLTPHVRREATELAAPVKLYAAPLSDAAWARILGPRKASRWGK